MAEATNTTNPAVLRALADRCAHEGPSYALDQAIAEAIDLPNGFLPNYTASIDAALTLVPDGDDVFWRLGHDGGGADPGAFKAQVLVCRLAHPAEGFVAVADRPALALCAAALRARAALADGDA
jgi:hypothetical protein